MNEIAALIYQYKQYGFSYVFKKFMNPNRSYGDLEFFMNEFVHSTSNPHIQSPSTFYVTGIDEIDFMVFNSLLNQEALRKGFTIKMEEGIIAKPVDNGYHPQYVIYHFDEFRIVLTTAGCDFKIEQYLRKKDEAGE